MNSIVVIGGGTGTYTVLRGLKQYTHALTAVVSMFDNGGSTGRLRDEFGYLPPGDVRRCLLALSPETPSTFVMRQLFDYRFNKGEGLSGHSFGNLLLTALKEITGSEVDSIKQAQTMLRATGRVLPVTFTNSQLCAELENGIIVRGETNIDIPKHDPDLTIKRVFLEPPTQAIPEVIDALLHTDMIVLAPGDLFTSLLPNLLVEGVTEAIQNSHATKVYVCNLMTKRGETTNFTVSSHVNEIEKYLGKNVLNIIVCNNKLGSPVVLQRYALENAYPVHIDLENLHDRNIIQEDLITEPELIRHDPDKLAQLLLTITRGEYVQNVQNTAF